MEDAREEEEQEAQLLQEEQAGRVSPAISESDATPSEDVERSSRGSDRGFSSEGVEGEGGLEMGVGQAEGSTDEMIQRILESGGAGMTSEQQFTVKALMRNGKELGEAEEDFSKLHSKIFLVCV